jgi:glutamine synthetase adenylyltransferase
MRYPRRGHFVTGCATLREQVKRQSSKVKNEERESAVLKTDGTAERSEITNNSKLKLKREK